MSEITKEQVNERRRENAVRDVEVFMDECFHHLHPVEKAKAFREIQGRAVEKACEQERINDEHGVPD